MVLHIARQRGDGLENFLANRFIRNANAQLPFNAGHNQEHIERIDIDISTEERHIIGHRGGGAELEISPENRANLIQDFWVKGRCRHGPYHFEDWSRHCKLKATAKG